MSCGTDFFSSLECCINKAERTMGALERVLPLTVSRRICTLSTVDHSKLIKSHSPENSLINTRRDFGENPSSENVSSWNKMLFRYVQDDQMQYAQQLFDKIPVKDIVSWNTMLSAFNKAKNVEAVLKHFLALRRVGLSPCERTISMVLKAASGKTYGILVPQIHGHVVCLGLKLCVFVGSALIKGYASLGDQVALSRVFDEILLKNISSWNALVSGYMEIGCVVEAQRAFDAMPEKNIISWTSLVHGYIANKMISKARTIFDGMDERDVTTWTGMINGYVQNGRFVDALELFQLMVESGTRPNDFTFSCVLDACSGSSSLLMGQQVHSFISKSAIPENVFVCTSLVEMYGKCGEMDAAFCVFVSMTKKNLVTWNSIIGCCARHGLASRAVEQFERMINCGIRPDEVTFTSVLSACGHRGLVKEGQKHFESMSTTYGIQPQLEHYTCMVDLYGRAGMLDHAAVMIEGMPFEPDVVLWGALLGACGLHSSLELGAYAAEGIEKLKEDHPVTYAMLSKIHGDRGQWTDIIELRKMMKVRRVKKQKAGSWTESPSCIR